MKKTLFLFGLALTLLIACKNTTNQPENQNTETAPIQDTAVNKQTGNLTDTAQTTKEQGEKEEKEEKDKDD
ncbi:MAG: hypothetical protein IT233_04240 [Bacteroidia bacterium]|nr:hypothetical protein [Bacteroidia bacterium]